ncbi:hypothetical protein EN904_01405 [Mesorhizobium sp. M7A.F.Ca.CA.001.07.2.1]|nr:hypothetical protein EN983_03790 [Mesorhizobium sp. M7A.F.Ca.CA.004.08.2.1]RUX86884.1 hypothetical protein EN982_13200 [Mesorhizobium sp. M7A.F.Ca.CA.004.08.1.1]RUY06906.1 hypothetical protein EN985_05270 [Mesorhizobium sp. M7A.F.Ca.CA.004.04.1.1]RUY29564.1 hypothetical protein EN984_07425 [Mesorhizobium sp. M7A.F.Ca.CA.004.12.1.1]RUY58148.1 hypothetical protein EN973_04040 [Mesorhizobium sp. M7A.F.Ca.CA.001.12.1.1]RUY90544.1 hypothetical protein EN964_09125 [Mesorhizobium sp. M7A.F.Ca.CA.0
MGSIIAIIASVLGINRTLADVIAIAATIAVASGAVWGGYELIKHWGADEVRAKIEKDNQDAIRKGIDASRNFDNCNSAGGLWDFRRERCSSPPGGDR